MLKFVFSPEQNLGLPTFGLTVLSESLEGVICITVSVFTDSWIQRWESFGTFKASMAITRPLASKNKVNFEEFKEMYLKRIKCIL